MRIATCIVGTLALAAFAGANAEDEARAGNVTLERLLAADQEPDWWMTGGRDWRQSYYSPLTGIDAANVGELGFAWDFDLEFTSTLEATPIVVDGVLYTSGNGGRVYALDAASGTLLWKFEPAFDPKHDAVGAGYGEVNRGVAVWNGKVYVGAVDGWLYALNAADGSVAWKVDTIVDRRRAYSITGAPYIARNRVIIGNSGAEYDARGYFTAYDTETGELAWRFFTVPGDPKKGFEHPELEKAARTWSPKTRWEVGLGGTVWDGMAYDPELNLLYVGTGNGVPWDRNIRSPGGGDNLFLSCILALNPDTGRLVWYYQTTPGDTLDYTATQKMILADLTIDGRKRRTIMQAPKNGFFYVLDRETGELISAKPYAKVNWATGVDLETGRPQETSVVDYSREPKIVMPGPVGAHQWQPMSHNPVTGLVYIPVQEIAAVFLPPREKFEYKRRQLNWGITQALVQPDGTLPSGFLPEGMKLGEPLPRPRMYLRAWDPLEQRVAWEVEMIGDVTNSYFVRRPGGVMSTASSLVFQGHIDGHFRVFDGRTGAQLRDIYVGTSMLAAPMTYRVAGEQYVSIMAGVGVFPGYEDYKYGNKGRIVTFKLGGGDVPLRTPVSPPSSTSQESALPPAGTPEQVQAGRALYERHCALCHAAGRAPDLTRMSAATHAEFADILLKGTRAGRGMPGFDQALSQADVRAIQAFLIDAARERAEQPENAQQPRPLAQRLIASCEMYAARNKLPPLSIAVVDESGGLVAFTRQEGASPVTAEVALMKARSAARVQVPTSVLATVAAQDQAARDTYALLELVAMPGGWPFSDGDGKVRGAIGVSGALAQDDSACAQHAVEANR
ncbi:MAG TPA: PQQ-dependent dehydrogenase, methanol/ethanol family [Steroidobacteraceae bacterium]